jgi:hypothetical protein
MGAAQVGGATVLGVLRLDADYAEHDVWTAQTVFLAWFALIAVVAGTAVGARSAGLGLRVSASVAATVGSLAGTAIALVPAGHAHIPNGDPRWQAGLALGMGAAVGLVFAFAALSARALAWSAGVYALLTWGLIAGAVGRSADQPARLGGLAGLGLSPAAVDDTQLFGLPAIAAVVGVLVALIARLRGHHRLAVALSGAAGPMTVALAYAIAGPGSSDFQKLPWIAALGAVVTGLATSVIVALPPRRKSADSADADVSGAGTTIPMQPSDAPELPSRREWKAENSAPARSATPTLFTTSTPSTKPRPTNDSVESWVTSLGDAPPDANEKDRPFVPRPLG